MLEKTEKKTNRSPRWKLSMHAQGPDSREERNQCGWQPRALNWFNRRETKTKATDLPIGSGAWWWHGDGKDFDAEKAKHGTDKYVWLTHHRRQTREETKTAGTRSSCQFREEQGIGAAAVGSCAWPQDNNRIEKDSREDVLAWID